MYPYSKPAYGRRLMPLLLDELARTQPDREYAAIPKSPDILHDVSIIQPGGLKLASGGAVKLLYPVETAPIIQPIRALKPEIHTEVIPLFEEMINSKPEYYLYEKSFDEAKHEPAAALHSSGSTGLPKPITMTHGSFAVLDNEHNLPEIPGRKKRDWTMWTWKGEGRLYTIFPFFHVAAALFGNTSIVFGPPNLVPDGKLLKNILLHRKLQALLLPPAIIEQILIEPNGVNFFKGLEFLAYSGAPFNQANGAKLSEVVELISPFGSTETYPIPQLALPREDWAWKEFNPFIKHEMQLFDSEEGTFELVLFADETTKDTAAIYHNLPGVGEFHTKDLFTRHPDKPTLFKYYGRKDDIIVLSNGEKFNPIPLELSVQSHPAVKGALVTGNRRTQAALLVEPQEPALTEEEKNRFLSELWPHLEKSNLLVPGQGRIHRGKLVCALPDKPFVRTGKGTIARRVTDEAYKEEIEKLYSSTNPTVTADLKPKLLAVYEVASVTNFLRSILTAYFPLGATIAAEDDLFAHGLDSVQTIEIVSALRHNLQTLTTKPVEWISPRTVFQQPTINDLSRLITEFLNNGTTPDKDSNISRATALDEVVASYVELLPKKRASQVTERPKPSKVVVIGSTGYLGSYIISDLLKLPEISQIYCLNRSKEAQKRQEEKVHELDESPAPLLHKLKYMTIDIGQPRFGLKDHEYEEIANEVDTIIYNAWRVDFGLSIRSYHQFLRATVNVIELSAASKRNVHVVFVSSISSVSKMAMSTTVPETAISDPLASLDTGYGQSKLAVERILTTANEVSGIPVSIIRVCQLGGPSPGKAGKWADQPWLSALIRTSRAIKCIPKHVTAIDWVPVDIAASMMRDFITRPVQQEAQVYHICHPSPQRWELLVDILRELLAVADTTPLREWTRKLRQITDPSPEDIAQMPALTILDFLEELGDREVLRDWISSWNL
ncbi:acetyl-CoA synthetase-like protein [Daldinia eschscholtzii]|nr:acetyl-CoA synthetase-like protein [Daldinia eschscholtzii]